MTPRLVAVAALTLITLGACALPSGPAGRAPERLPEGRTFLSTSVTEDGSPRPLVGDTRIRLAFSEDGVSADAGCNIMNGAARLSDGTLVVSSLSQTEMGCPEGRMEQDQWVGEFLTGSPRLRLDGDELTLSLASVSIVLLDREVADPDRPLTGTEWTVDTIVEGSTASSVASPVPAVLVIDPAGSFMASTGCVGGEVIGTATVLGDTITFTALQSQPCAGAGNALDEAVRAVLDAAVRYEITAASLRLTGTDGKGLGLRAAA